jgi:hypothetical protein
MNKVIAREKFEAEIIILLGCKSDYSFFQRLILKTIPLIRKLFPEQVNLWKDKSRENNTIKKINDELTSAFIELWKHAKEKRKWDLQKKLIRLLQQVRGPRFDFGDTLLRRIFPDLQELHVNHLGFSKKYPFFTLTFKIMDWERSRKYNNAFVCNHRDYSLGEACDQCLTKCHPFYQIERTWNFVGWRKFSEKKKWSLLKKTFQKKFKFAKSFFSGIEKNENSSLKKYLARVNVFKYQVDLYELRRAFSPTAQTAYNISLKQHKANAECFVEIMWTNLEVLEACWGFKDEKLLQKRWPRIKVKSHEIGLLGSEAYNTFLLIWKAQEFALLDLPNYLCTYLKREKFQEIVETISKELFINDIILDQKTLITDQLKKKLKQPLRESDEEKFCDWYNNWLILNKNKSGHQKTYKIAITHYRKEETAVTKRKKAYPSSTLKTWMRDFHARQKAIHE